MALQGVAVCPPHSLSMESSTPECVEKSLDTNIIQLMHLHHIIMTTGAQLVISMLMVSASLTIKDQGNTYGPFIGQDCFCDRGSRYEWRAQWYHADPLWDGSGCGPTSSCCGFNNPPWFCKQLPQPTTDDIEMRVCINEAISNEYIALETVQIFVQ